MIETMKKEYIAPIISAAALLIYYIAMAVMFVLIPEITWWVKVLLCIIPASFGGVVIHVLVQRIKEIKSGETDDLDKY